MKEIFVFTPAGVSTDDFIEIIKDNYGYDDYTSKSALEFMNKKEFIKIVNEKVYPIKINKNEEVAHILLNYPMVCIGKKFVRLEINLTQKISGI